MQTNTVLNAKSQHFVCFLTTLFTILFIFLFYDFCKIPYVALQQCARAQMQNRSVHMVLLGSLRAPPAGQKPKSQNDERIQWKSAAAGINLLFELNNTLAV